jgi:hypothetical protein
MPSWSVLARSVHPRLVVCLAPALVFSASAARAESRQCIEQHARAQDLRREGNLLQAKLMLAACSRDERCPSVVSAECTEMLEQLRPSIPSVVFAAVSPEGRDTVDVEVYVDGELRLQQLPLKAVEFNPGQYRFRFVAASGESIEQPLLLREGERNRRLVIDFRPPGGAPEPAFPEEPPEEPPAEEPSSPTASYVLGGIGLASLGSFAFFAVQGRRIQERCIPTCSDEEVDVIYRNYLVADISLGVGLVALTTATILYFTHDSTPARRNGAASRRSRSVEMDAGVLPGGGFLGLNGHF